MSACARCAAPFVSSTRFSSAQARRAVRAAAWSGQCDSPAAESGTSGVPGRRRRESKHPRTQGSDGARRFGGRTLVGCVRRIYRGTAEHIDPEGLFGAHEKARQRRANSDHLLRIWLRWHETSTPCDPQSRRGQWLRGLAISDCCGLVEREIPKVVAQASESGPCQVPDRLCLRLLFWVKLRPGHELRTCPL